MKQRAHIQKPLLGFGWAGYTASAILLAMIVAIAAGVDLRYELLKLIRAAFGDEVMTWFVLRLHTFIGAIGYSTTSIITGIGLLVALRISPYRTNTILHLASFIICVIWAIVPIQFFRLTPVETVGEIIFGKGQFGIPIAGFFLLELIGTIIVAAAAIWITRSWTVLVGFLLAIATQIVASRWLINQPTITLPDSAILFMLFDIEPYSWFTLAFDICTIGSLLLWAILERRKAFPVHACKQCGYDLAGIPTESPCPECGQKPAAATT